MYHGDVPDDVGQALVQQREDDNAQRGPLGLEPEPEAQPLVGPGGPPEGRGAWAAGSSVSLLGLGAVKLLSRQRRHPQDARQRNGDQGSRPEAGQRPYQNSPCVPGQWEGGCPRIEGHQGAAEPSIAPAGGVEKGQGQTCTPTGHSGEVQTPKSGEAATLPGKETKAAAGGPGAIV